MIKLITDRIDAITKIPESHRLIKPPAPKSVKIELTARCNFACTFCARADILRKQADMDQGFYARVLQEMRSEGVEEIGLFYLGESFLLPWLPWAIKYAKQVCKYPYVFITTNGSLATRGKVEECMYAGLDSLKFSLNYADEEQFAEITRVKPSIWAKVIQNIKEAYEVRSWGSYDCGLYASYILYDGEQGEKMKKVVEEITPFVDEIYALPLYTQADLVTEEEEKRGWLPSAGNRGRIGALRESLPCWALFTEGHITYDGNLSACCFDHAGQFHMGDLNTTTFMNAWHSKKFQELRKVHLEKDVTGTVCENCVAYATVCASARAT